MSDAEKKFWRTPELVECLLPYLNTRSVSKLAQAHQLTVEVLQGTALWNKLVFRSCPYYWSRNTSLYSGVPEKWKRKFHKWTVESFAVHSTPIRWLVAILKKMENPKDSLLELLHVICERFPPVTFHLGETTGRDPMLFKVSCPCKRSHQVSHLGFLLLEKVEGALGSALQEIERVYLQYLEEPWFSAVCSRMFRQQRAVLKVHVKRIVCTNESHPRTLLALLESCTIQWLEEVEVRVNISKAGWTNIARACVQLGVISPGSRNSADPPSGVFTFQATWEVLHGAKREDLRTIWDALVHGKPNQCDMSVFHVLEVPYDGSLLDDIELEWDNDEDKEKEWRYLQELLDTPPWQWTSALKQKCYLRESGDSDTE